MTLFFTSCEEVTNENGNGNGDSQAITINNVAGPEMKGCGGFEWKTSFSLANDSDSGGYFVQKIRIHRDATKECPTNYNEEDITYWEAWKVNADTNVTTYLEKDPDTYDDMYAWTSWPNSEGFHTNTGDLKFFEGLSLPGHFKKNNPNTFAGMLPSTTKEPDFWGEGESRMHNLETEWDCCDDSTQTIDIIPDFTALEEDPKLPSGGDFFEHVEPLPAWSNTHYTDAHNSMLKEHAQQLQQLSTQEIMNGIEEYTRYYKGRVAPLSKLYVMMRMLFDVPENTPMDQAKTFGGWVKPDELIAGEQTSLLWPLAMGDDRIPAVEAKFKGYMGAPYDAEAEALYFMEQFGRREF